MEMVEHKVETLLLLNVTITVPKDKESQIADNTGFVTRWAFAFPFLALTTQ